MKESYWGYWLVMLGILVIGVMLLINSTTTGTTQDYYELKETTQAAVVDSVDYSYYRLYGDLKISKEKFIENFIRRFSESATMTKEYNISFYDIHEVPPKVSIKVSSVSNSVNVANTANSFDLVNKIDVILVGGSSSENFEGDASTSQKICFTVDLSTQLALALKEILTTPNSTYDIPEDLATRIRKANLSTLRAWANKGGNVNDPTYMSEFKSAMYDDFLNSFANSSSMKEFYRYDPTRIENEEGSGILEFATKKQWITKI